MLAANLETAINGLWDANPRIGDRVVVVGAGTVGSLVAWLAGRIHGCDVELVDVNPKRAVVAKALGVRFSAPEAVADGADVVVHASGSAAGLSLALRIAAFEATIVELSWYGDQMVSLPLGQAFHARRLTIKSSQVGSVASSQRARWDFRRRMAVRAGVARRPGARRAHHRRVRVRIPAAGDGRAGRRHARRALSSRYDMNREARVRERSNVRTRSTFRVTFYVLRLRGVPDV